MDNFYDTAKRMQKSSKILFNNNDYHNSCYLAGYIIECYLKILFFNVSNSSNPPFTHKLTNLHSSIMSYLSSGNSSLNSYYSNNSFSNVFSDWDPFTKRYTEQNLEWSDINAQDYQNEISVAMQTLAQMRIDGYTLI
ncbi:HEPN domain-containing protein [Chryseobacterium aquaticum]|uniref:HEPN domain-containing protein n=1 Tax=Chryseobacterium aquaticum TaxID=452084 RepID=A0A848N6H6_9FLAO|nr:MULTISPECIES: HEPN domain-containing protein [Chryseobacterium]NMR34348.1 HEPN domain-containing protein [Chryseobacterium aquaticum]NRQ46668.1 HEPN domain-containing protein [Chryseobacterium sp. C-204]